MVVETEARSGTPWLPGPWSYRPEPHDDWGVVRAGRYWICQAKDPRAIDDETLARHRAARSDPWEANAHLIAAAPAMADAIAAYLDAFDAGTGTVYVEPQLRAALSLARGEQA